MLGHKLVQQLSSDFDVSYTLRNGFESVREFGIFDPAKAIINIDVMDLAAVERAVDTARPDVVLNAAGVIKQLPSSNDVIQTLTINSLLPHQLSRLSNERGFRLICISTDCVFSGSKGGYTEQDIPDAYDLYGKSKNLGEVAASNAITLRTSIIGRELRAAHSLVEWFLGNRGGKVKGFAGAIYSGFPTIVFADIIRDLITDHRHVTGLYHVSSDPINKYDLLQLIKKAWKLDIEIDRDEEFKIDRSLDSSVFREVAGFNPESWPAMIERMAADPTPYDDWKR